MFLRLSAILAVVSVGVNGQREDIASAATPSSVQAIPQPTLSPPLAAFGFDYPAVVEKKVVSTRMRIVFLVGLEGTGHHYLAGVLQNMCSKASVPCPNTCLVAQALYPGISTPTTADEYELARRQLRQEMEVLASYPSEQLPEGEAAMASFGQCRSSGMMSYPNFNGKTKALQYVDFRLLAEEAERAGVDLRFVYLARSARSILTSDTQHHQYGGTFMKESRTLINNAAVIESLFREVGPGFATCFHYEDMSDPSQAFRVANFIAPTESVAKRLSSKMIDSARPRRTQQQSVRENVEQEVGATRTATTRPGTGDSGNELELSTELVVARLQQKLNQIEKGVCMASSINNSYVP